MYDVSQGGAAYEVKRITSHQRERRFIPRIKNRDVSGWNYLYFIDQIVGCAPSRMQINCIPDVDVLKTAEESVSMSGNAYVS